MGEEEKWYCTFTRPQVAFFTHVGDEKNGIAHLQGCKWFLLHIGEENEWYCTFVGPQVVFLTNAIEEKKWYAHLWSHD
jgi:hypothetical protein